ncbi:YdeI/OmpD-associated family protein [Sphingomonas sp. 1P06PA]|uniref:YdeI/OmpD-associated family protein n=1 Tax=Sphingomonas sp. 1P06PA TaxID=554121 RepID=UPI0039A4E7A6
MNRDPRIDAYIERAQPFAQPILRHIRGRMHAACPDGEETMKWSSPSFTYQGEILAGMAAFKAHAALNFWKGGAVTDGIDGAMGRFGKLTSIADLPDDAAFDALVTKAMALVGTRTARPKPDPKPRIDTPADMTARLAADPAAQAVWNRFPPGQRREYVTWIVEARRPETRAKRLDQAIAWIADGKRRNWKYENC